jgi:hypothetical protein
LRERIIGATANSSNHGMANVLLAYLKTWIFHDLRPWEISPKKCSKERISFHVWLQCQAALLITAAMITLARLWRPKFTCTKMMYPCGVAENHHNRVGNLSKLKLSFLNVKSTFIMKKVKIMLMFIALFAIVGGALAFKANFDEVICFAQPIDDGGLTCSDDQVPIPCEDEKDNATTEDLGNGDYGILCTTDDPECEVCPDKVTLFKN